MFEQSILIDHATGNKPGAFAASITLQAAGLAALVLIPLFYSDRLPAVLPFISLTAPVSLAPVIQPVDSAPVPRPERPGLLPARIFRPRPSSTSFSVTPVIIDSAAPALGLAVPATEAAPVAILPRIIEAPARPRENASAAAPARIPVEPIPVGGDVQSAKLIRKVVPEYPPLARAARISGTVHLVGIIAKDGTIQKLQVVSGNPLLIQAALEAVRQWIYRPTLLNGVAVEVTAPIDVVFVLSR